MLQFREASATRRLYYWMVLDISGQLSVDLVQELVRLGLVVVVRITDLLLLEDQATDVVK